MFKKIINSLLLLLSTFTCFITPSFAKTTEVNLAYIGNTDHTAYLGVQQGLSEANLQGKFLNHHYTLVTITPEESLTTDYDNYIAVITAVDTDSFKKITAILPDKPVFNVTIGDDNLRLDCLDNALHVIPSDQMKSDAEDQWNKKEPNSKAVAQAWHQDFKKFAARDLNKRFLKEHQTKMDDYAWAGWAAIKIASDTITRENITDSTKLLTYLKTDLSFDGQKGIDMNFRQTGQLRQPLIIVQEGKIVAEAPIRGIATPPTVDSLGNLNCAK